MRIRIKTLLQYCFWIIQNIIKAMTFFKFLSVKWVKKLRLSEKFITSQPALVFSPVSLNYPIRPI